MQVSLYLNYCNFSYIVIALAGNKSDLYESEKVREEEGAKVAKKIGAIFKYTSACTGTNINLLFKIIGEKMLESKNKKKSKSKNKKKNNQKERKENIINNKFLDNKKYDNEDNIVSDSNSIKIDSDTIKKKKKKKCC